jgi:hypothetical protein
MRRRTSCEGLSMVLGSAITYLNSMTSKIGLQWVIWTGHNVTYSVYNWIEENLKTRKPS